MQCGHVLTRISVATSLVAAVALALLASAAAQDVEQGEGEPATASLELPSALYASGDGCRVLADTPLDDVQEMNFMTLSPQHLIGQEFGCWFEQVEPLEGDGRGWKVSGQCESGGEGEAADITITDIGGSVLNVTLTIDGEPDNLGRFLACPKVAE